MKPIMDTQVSNDDQNKKQSYSTDFDRFTGVEHGFKALSPCVSKISPKMAILVPHEAQFGHLGNHKVAKYKNRIDPTEMIGLLG